MNKLNDKLIYVGNTTRAISYGAPCLLIAINENATYDIKIKKGTIKQINADAFVKYTLEEYNIIHLEIELKADAAKYGNLEAFNNGELNTIARRIITGIPF